MASARRASRAPRSIMVFVSAICPAPRCCEPVGMKKSGQKSGQPIVAASIVIHTKTLSSAQSHVYLQFFRRLHHYLNTTPTLPNQTLQQTPNTKLASASRPRPSTIKKLTISWTTRGWDGWDGYPQSCE